MATPVIKSMEKEEGDNLVNLGDLIVELDNTGSYFLNVFSNKGLDIGILISFPEIINAKQLFCGQTHRQKD